MIADTDNIKDKKQKCESQAKKRRYSYQLKTNQCKYKKIEHWLYVKHETKLTILYKMQKVLK